MLNNIQFIIPYLEHIWNMTGSVNERVLELIWQDCGLTSYEKSLGLGTIGLGLVCLKQYNSSSMQVQVELATLVQTNQNKVIKHYKRNLKM